MKKIETKLKTGVKTTITKKRKSLIKNNEEKVTRIDVDSDTYNMETIYQDVSLETACKEEREKQNNNLLKNLHG